MPKDSTHIYGLHIYSPREGEVRIEVEQETVRTYENGDAMRVSSLRALRQFSALTTTELPGPVLLVGQDGKPRRATYADLQVINAASASALADDEQAAVAEAARGREERRAAEAEAAALGKVAPPLSNRIRLP